VNNTEFDDLARSLWQEEPSEEEQQAFRQLARRASLRARLLRHADLAFAAMLSVAILIGLVFNPEPATAAITVLVVIALSWSSWKRHLLGRMPADGGSDDRGELLRAAVLTASVSLRRSTIGLFAMLPCLLLGALLGHSYRSGGRLEGFLEAFRAAVTQPSGAAIALIAMLSFAILIRGNLRLRRELWRLEILQREYGEEAERDRCSLETRPDQPGGSGSW
jgi:hypothetical protein